mmetsp:Transcript_46755/g.102092  ORF Transcript_46755/g.102092 Transcript_46755/m.102092 type:complete len:276 (+) Transcript_46755:71-898(+)
MYSRASCSRCRQLVWVSREQVGQAQLQCRRCQLHIDDGLSSICGICLDVLVDPVRYTTVSNESWTNDKCSHRFCRGCLRGHLRAKLEDGAWNIRCPAVNCPYLWLERDVEKVTAPRAFVEDADRDADKSEGEQLLQRFRSLRSIEYGAHLRAILEQQDVEERRLEDAKSDSIPITMAGGDDQTVLKATAGDLQDDPSQDFESWARLSCQACPKCLVVVRKEIGCDHMQCRCGMSFCYGCGAPYDAAGSARQCICNGRSREGPKLARWLRAEGKIL